MVSLFFYKTAGAVLIFFVSLTVLFFPFNKQNILKNSETLELGEALASGIFLGTAFFHMLPEAQHIFSLLYPQLTYPFPEFICIGGFLLMLFLERLALIRKKSSLTSIPYILTIILIIHALVEGVAVGIATFSQAFILWIAILAHKLSESFALCFTMLRYQIAYRHIVFIIILFSFMTPLGIMAGSAGFLIKAEAPYKELLEACFNAFAAGTFIYISTLHHIQFHQHSKETQGIQEFLCLLFGIFIMAILAF